MTRQSIFGLVLAMLLPIAAWATGTIHLDGKLKSFTTQSIEVTDGHWDYIIPKDQLSPDQLKQVNSKKSGAKVDLWVAVDAIEATVKVTK